MAATTRAAAATSGGGAAAATTSGGDNPEQQQQQQQRGAGSLEPAPASGEVEELLGDDHLHVGQQQPEIHRHNNNIQAPAFGGSLDSASAIATAAAVKGRTGSHH